MDPWHPGWYPAHGVCAKGVCRGGTTTNQACGLRRDSSIHGDSVSSTAEGKTQLPPSAAETIKERVLKHLARQLPGRACHFPEQTRPSEAKDAALTVQARGSGFILSLFSRSSRQPFLLREPSPLLLQPPTPGQGHSPGTFSSTRKGPRQHQALAGHHCARDFWAPVFRRPKRIWAKYKIGMLHFDGPPFRRVVRMRHDQVSTLGKEELLLSVTSPL